MAKKQTAVEWLYVKLSTSSSDELVGNINNWFDQAKQMEKEQIIKSNRDGVDMVIAEEKYITGKDYYNETYGGKS
jgi:hypothetical protein